MNIGVLINHLLDCAFAQSGNEIYRIEDRAFMETYCRAPDVVGSTGAAVTN